MEYVNYIDVVVWSFVKRSGNRLAHTLAYLQPMEFGCRRWVDSFPDIVSSVAASDLLI